MPATRRRGCQRGDGWSDRVAVAAEPRGARRWSREWLVWVNIGPAQREPRLGFRSWEGRISPREVDGIAAPGFACAPYARRHVRASGGAQKSPRPGLWRLPLAQRGSWKRCIVSSMHRFLDASLPRCILSKRRSIGAVFASRRRVEDHRRVTGGVAVALERYVALRERHATTRRSRSRRGGERMARATSSGRESLLSERDSASPASSSPNSSSGNTSVAGSPEAARPLAKRPLVISLVDAPSGPVSSAVESRGSH